MINKKIYQNSTNYKAKFLPNKVATFQIFRDLS